MQADADQLTQEQLELLQSECQLFNDAEKGKFIDKKRRQTRKFMQRSYLLQWFPLNGIESDLPGCLARYYDRIALSLSAGEVHRKSQKFRNYPLRLISLQLPASWFLSRSPRFDISRVVDLNGVALYIATGRLLIRLITLQQQWEDQHPASQEKSLPVMRQATMKVDTEINTGVPDRSPELEMHAHIFTKGSHPIFCYLYEHFVKDEKTAKTKASTLFHFMTDHQFLICTKSDYMKYVELHDGLHLSKIFPKNFKTDQSELPYLTGLLINYNTIKKLETDRATKFQSNKVTE
jgi:hypothetical protein